MFARVASTNQSCEELCTFYLKAIQQESESGKKLQDSLDRSVKYDSADLTNREMPRAVAILFCSIELAKVALNLKGRRVLLLLSWRERSRRKMWLGLRRKIILL